MFDVKILHSFGLSDYIIDKIIRGVFTEVKSGATAIKIPANTLIEKFLIKDSTAGQSIVVSIGITPGGTELFDNEAIDTTNPQSGILSKDYYCKVATTIYLLITGAVPGTISLNIYKS